MNNNLQKIDIDMENVHKYNIKGLKRVVDFYNTLSTASPVDVEFAEGIRETLMSVDWTVARSEVKFIHTSK